MIEQQIIVKESVSKLHYFENVPIYSYFVREDYLYFKTTTTQAIAVETRQYVNFEYHFIVSIPKKVNISYEV